MEARVYVNVIRQGRHILVASCDAELLGKTLKHGKICFEVRRNFYSGSLVHVDEAIRMIRKATTANLVGTTIVEAAMKRGLVHPNAVLRISGVPHAQFVKL
ncbi:MAG: DUF424 domain-containing protein [Candidatus Bathyarchaeia archaeon]